MLMNKKVLFISLTIILSVILSGCGQSRTDGSVVSVSIAPLKYFVDRLTDQALEVNVMVPQGSSHGTYSPTAAQMQKLSDSKIYFRVEALGYEQAFIRRLNDMNPGMREVNLSTYVELIRGETIDHGDHVHEGGIDPHIWMSPRVMLTLLPVFRDNLMELYPELREVILENYPLLVADLEIIHQEMQEVTEDLSHRRFLIFHPALTYLARDYDMEQVSIEHEGKEPSPARLGRLIRDAKAENIPLIFIQEEYDVRNAQLVAQETGAQVETLNPMAYDWAVEMENIMEVFNKWLK
jgi:zinc transport system substrate-binding protein